jgi:AcrR family transcriptional regulator
VLNAAFSLFREHGFSSTSMLDIVTRAPNIETRPLRPIQEQARRTSRRKSRP